MKTIKIEIEEYKDTSLIQVVYDLFCDNIELTDEENDELGEMSSKIFEYSEYLNAEIIIDENLNIIGGRIIPFKEDWKSWAPK